LKVYDTTTKKNSTLDVESVSTIKRMPTQHFSSVNFGSDIIMTGGKFDDDDTCSQESYRIDSVNGELTEMGCKLQTPRMQHSMIAIIERGMMLVVGGEDESGNLLDTCEAYIL
jgi:6-phosphogluconolactonase (cycloisomerase 2 family)